MALASKITRIQCKLTPVDLDSPVTCAVSYDIYDGALKTGSGTAVVPVETEGDASALATLQTAMDAAFTAQALPEIDYDL